MATPDATIRIGQVGLEQDIQRAIQRVNSKGGLNVKLNSRSFTQPLGKITASADEFTKSIEASNARVIAFGASVGIINAITGAFKNLITETVALERRLAEVNVVLGASSASLNSFGKQLFDVARNTAQSFDVVSEAALEFSRQGLSMEETLKRTRDALILTRLTGLKAADSVKGLTATINSFATAGLNTAEIISKLAAVDVEFAVSSEDLINALSRAGAVAQDAGLDFDQLVAAVTSAQQITARGGAVIGNSFKTIFTRIQRSDTLDRLQELGIAVRNVHGETLPAMMILQQLAHTYDGLADATKSAVAEQVGGVFQINVLKAALKDLSSENSIYSRAVTTSAGATDEAIRKNDQLNQTLAALGSQALVSIKELSAAVGEITVGPGIEKVLNMVNDLSQGATKLLDGEGIGSNLANGILKGIGTIISGPGLVIIGGLIGKLFVDVTTFAAKSFKNIIGLNKGAQQQKALQDSIFTTLQSNERINRVLAQLEGNKAAQAKFLFDEVSRTTTEYNKQLGLANQLASTLGKMGVISGPAGLTLGGRRGRSQNAARGFIPNYNIDPVTREAMDVSLGVGGVTKSAKPVTLKNFNTGKGIVDMVANTQEVYVKNFDGKGGDAVFNPDMMRQFGVPAGARKISAARGFIPNYALTADQTISSASAKRKGSPLLGKNLDESVAFWSTLKGKAQKDVGAAITNDIGGWGVLGKEALDAARTSKQSTSSKKSSSKKLGALTLKLSGQGYGVVTPDEGKSTATTVTANQSEIFKKGGSPFSDRNVKFVMGDLHHAKISRGAKGQFRKKIDEEVFGSIKNLTNYLLGTGNLGANLTRGKLSDVLDSAAGPQLKGRIFESALDLTSMQLGKDAQSDKSASGLIDYPSGIPKNLDKLFGGGQRLREPHDAKFNMGKGSEGPPSMIMKIITAKKALGKKALKDHIQKTFANKEGAQQLFTAAQGFLPNISIKASDLPALQDSIGREKAAGIPNFAIRVSRSPRLKTPSNPSGLAVTNTIDEPAGLSDVFRQRRIMTAAEGFIPNFAEPGPIQTKGFDPFGKNFNAQYKKFAEKLKRATKQAAEQEAKLKKANDVLEKQENILKDTNSRLEKIRSEHGEDLAKLQEAEDGVETQKEILKTERSILARLRKTRDGLMRKAKEGGDGASQARGAAKKMQKEIDEQALKVSDHARFKRAHQTAITKLKNNNEELDKYNTLLKTQNKAQDKVNEAKRSQEKAEEQVTKATKERSRHAGTMQQAETQLGGRVARSQQRMQMAGMGVMIGGPMLVAAIEEGMFKGMSRVQMNEAQRMTQGGLQGAGTGIATAGMLAMFLPGGPLIKAVVGFGAVAISAMLGMKKAADLTFDELQQKFSESTQKSQEQLDAANKIIDARRAIRESLGDESVIKNASQVIKENFQKIKDVNLQKTLSDTSLSLDGMREAAARFQSQISLRGNIQQSILDFAKLGENKKGDTAGDLASPIAGLLSTVKAAGLNDEDMKKLRQGLGALKGNISSFVETVEEGPARGVKKGFTKQERKNIENQTKNLRDAVVSSLVDTIRDANTTLSAAEIKNLAKDLDTELKQLRVFARSDIKVLGNVTDQVQMRAKDALLSLLGVVDVFSGEITNILPQSRADDIVAADLQIVSKLQEINEEIASNLRENLEELQKNIVNERFRSNLMDKISTFRQGILGSVLDRETFFNLKESQGNDSLSRKFQADVNELAVKNIEKLTNQMKDVFGATDAGAGLVKNLSKQFKNSPRETVSMIERLITTSDATIDDIGKTFQGVLDAQVKPMKQLKENLKSKFQTKNPTTKIEGLTKDLQEQISNVFGGVKGSDTVGNVLRNLDREIQAYSEDGAKSFSKVLANAGKSKQDLLDTVKEIAIAFDKLDSNNKEKLAMNAIDRATADKQLSIAREINKVQNEYLAKANRTAREIQSISSELARDIEQIDLGLQDPLSRVGGNANVRRQAEAARLKLELRIAAEKKKNEIQNQQALDEIFQNQALLTAMGLQHDATKLNTSAVSQLTAAILNSKINEGKDKIQTTKGQVGNAKVRTAEAQVAVDRESDRLNSLRLIKDVMPKGPNSLTESNFLQSINSSDDATTAMMSKMLGGGDEEKGKELLASLRSALGPDVTTGAGLDAAIAETEETLKEAKQKREKENAALESVTKKLETQKTAVDDTQRVLDFLRTSIDDINNIQLNNIEGNTQALQNFIKDTATENLQDTDENALKTFRKGVAEQFKLGEKEQTAAEQAFSKYFNVLKVGTQKITDLANSADAINTRERFGFDANSFQAGVVKFREDLDTEMDGFGAKLGRDVPAAFRDGMTNALSAVINQTDDLKSALGNIAISFLQTIQRAFLQNAANNLVKSMGIGDGVGMFNKGGYVGNKSVPAMLTNGEYVMGKEAVQRLGISGMDKLNKGTFSVQGFASGGKVGNKARKAYSSHMSQFGTAFDSSKSARFYGEFWESVPKARKEVALKSAAEQEAKAERDQKKAQKKSLITTILGTLASVAISAGTSKLSQTIQTRRFASGDPFKSSVIGPGSIAFDKTTGQVGLPGGGNGPLPKGAFDLNSYLASQGAGFASPAQQRSILLDAKKEGLWYQGGPVQAYASGGQVRGPAGRDVIPAVLTEGEYVIKASSARKYGKRFLDNLNYGSQGYYNGGATGPMPAGGNQNFNVNMNFDVSSSGETKTNTEGEDNNNKDQLQGVKEFSAHIKNVVQEEIRKQQRVGGMLRR